MSTLCIIILELDGHIFVFDHLDLAETMQHNLKREFGIICLQGLSLGDHRLVLWIQAGVIHLRVPRQERPKLRSWSPFGHEERLGFKGVQQLMLKGLGVVRDEFLILSLAYRPHVV